MILEQDIREKFEAWAVKQGLSLIRHPNSEDFYYIREVSSLWICFSEAYILGRSDENECFKDLIDEENEISLITAAQEILIERTVELDE